MNHTTDFCPHCGTTLPAVSDPFCPQCRQELDAPVNPVQQVELSEPKELEHAYEDGLTTGEQIYSALVFVCAGFMLLSVASLHFLVIPESEEPSTLYFVVSMIWGIVFALTVTTILNLSGRRLRIIPTILQVATLTLTIYFIPLAIWGGKLLRRRIQRTSNGE